MALGDDVRGRGGQHLVPDLDAGAVGEQEPPLLPQGLAVAPEDLEGGRADPHHAAVHEAAARLGRPHQDLGLGRRRPRHHGEHGQMLGERRHLAVERPHPLPLHPADLQGGAAVGLDLPLDVEGAGAVPRAVADLGGAEAAGGGEHVDRLQQARLAGAVAAEQEMRARRRAARRAARGCGSRGR